MTPSSLKHYQNSPLTNEQLRKAAPSVFATEPWHAMSSKYAFIPTIQIVERLRAEGFQPFAAAQSRTRIPGKGDFTKHLIRFRDMRQGDSPAVRSLGQLYPERGFEEIAMSKIDGAAVYLTQRQLRLISPLMVDLRNVSEDNTVLEDARRIYNKVQAELEAANFQRRLANQKQH